MGSDDEIPAEKRSGHEPAMTLEAMDAEDFDAALEEAGLK